MTEKRQKTQPNDGPGNTRSGPENGGKKDTESRSYCFTWNNYCENDISYIIGWFEKKKGCEYVFQEEKGKEGTKHLQGTFRCKSAVLFSSLKNKFPEAHLEVTKNWSKSIAYCSKTDSRVGKVYTNMKLPNLKKKPRHHFDIERGNNTWWQKKIMDLMTEEPDERKILWFWSENGAQGKTSLARYLVDTYENEIIYVSGKATDIKFAVTTWIKGGKDLRCVIFGFPRTMEKYISYEAIEAVKDGLFFSGKYEGEMNRFEIPHIIVFANYEPDYSALSSDRWDVHCIDDDQ